MTRSYAEFNQRAAAFIASGKVPCPDCGAMLPVDDDEARQAHYAQCGGIQATALPDDEQDERDECELTIERGFKAFCEVGEALARIRDKRLYRSTHTTFEDYCRERWQMVASRARQFIAAATVVTNIQSDTNGNTLPVNERQTRPLTPLAPDEQRLVWQVVQDTAPGGKVTEAHVRSVVNVLKEVTETGAIDDGSGEQIRVADALRAAITEETYEREKRQRQHIADNQKRKTILLHRFEFDSLSEFDAGALRLQLDGLRGRHIEVIIREIAE